MPNMLARIDRSSDWQSTDVLVADVLNSDPCMVNLLIRFHSAASHVACRIGFFPGWPTRVALPLASISGKTLFLDRTPGCFKTMIIGANLNFGDLTHIEILAPDWAGNRISVTNAHLARTMPTQFTFPDKPVVDDLHQWAGRSWPGKAQSIEQVRRELLAELDAPEPVYPQHWSKFGGWRDLPFSPTGFFRTHHDGKRWWLVDPDGFAFFSIGVDCVRMDVDANLTGIHRVLASPPPSPQSHPQFWSARANHFRAQAWNIHRTLGDDYESRWLELSRRRLVRYRFNTIANWSDPQLFPYCRVPFIFTMAGFPTTDTLLFRDFPDVFSPDYPALAAQWASQLRSIAGNPLVIGYFMTNEPQWAFINDMNIGEQILRGDQPSHSRTTLIQHLREKYTHIDALNTAWHSRFAGFDDLLRPVPSDILQRAKSDTLDFTRQAVDRYVRIPAAACRAVDCDHLNLGLRWAWIHSDYQLAAADTLDAFSINGYQLRPDPDMIARLVQKTGKPVMIGEFHIGSLDRGLPSGGIRNTRTLHESVAAYRHYVEHAVAIPGLVGVHYFQWNDQHVLGRFDGENMQIGLHDITGRPYPQWVDTCRDLHANLYRFAAGQLAPLTPEPHTVPDGTLVD